MQKKIKLKDISSILFIMYLFHLVFMIFVNNKTLVIKYLNIFIHLKYIDGYLVFR